jgi:hypothetical protein
LPPRPAPRARRCHWQGRLSLPVPTIPSAQSDILACPEHIILSSSVHHRIRRLRISDPLARALPGKYPRHGWTPPGQDSQAPPLSLPCQALRKATRAATPKDGWSGPHPQGLWAARAGWKMPVVRDRAALLTSGLAERGGRGERGPRRGLLRAQAFFLRTLSVYCTSYGRAARRTVAQGLAEPTVQVQLADRHLPCARRHERSPPPVCEVQYIGGPSLPPPPRAYAELYTEGGIYIREIHTRETVRRSPCCASSPRKHGGTVPPRLPHTMNPPCTIGRPGGPASAARAGARGRSPCQIPSPPPAPSPPPPAPSAPVVSGTGNGRRDPAFLDAGGPRSTK